jgi:hypothetical protein
MTYKNREDMIAHDGPEWKRLRRLSTLLDIMRAEMPRGFHDYKLWKAQQKAAREEYNLLKRRLTCS